MEQNETRRKRIAFLTSAGIHGLLLVLFLLSMAWRAPDPPLPEFGIELNFGDSPEGTGDVQPETPTASEQQEESEELPEEVAQPKQEESKQEVIPSNQESPVTVPKEEKPAVVEKPKVEEKKEEVKPAQKPATTEGAQPVSQGNDKDKTGDKGDPKGVPDPNAAYTGKPGGGAGGSGLALSMAGWAWAEDPEIPTLPDNEDGRVVFEIECDSEGEIVGIKVAERGLSAQSEKILLDVIRKNSLVRTSGGATPERSTGKVVFILKTK
jgi:protein TonB